MAQSQPAPRWRTLAPLLFLPLVALLYAAAFIYFRGYTNDIRKDEEWFWPATLHFAKHWIPTLEDLRSYHTPPTPLTFIIWGTIEHATGYGLILGRIINTVLCLGMVALILQRNDKGWPQRALAAIGLLACPYFLGIGVFLYTEAMSIAFVVFGTVAYLNKRHWASGLCMALAIACRQYMVVFPAAIGAWELYRAFRAGGPRALRDSVPAVLPQFLGAATLLGWILLFGGLAPKGAAEQYGVATASNPALVVPYRGLYFLTCIGAYFVVVESVLFLRFRQTLREVLTIRTAVWAVLLAVLFYLFPPLRNDSDELYWLGYLDRAARIVLPDLPRMICYWALAVLAAARLGRPDLGGLVLLLNALVLMKAHQGWDKYAIPALAILWLLKAREALDAPSSPAPPRP